MVVCLALLTVLAIFTAVPELTLVFACLFVALAMGADLEMACLEADWGAGLLERGVAEGVGVPDDFTVGGAAGEG